MSHHEQNLYVRTAVLNKMTCAIHFSCKISVAFSASSFCFRPGSDAVLHMSRIEFNELSSCEVRRLNQFETADIIRIGLAVLHGSSHEPNQIHKLIRREFSTYQRWSNLDALLSAIEFSSPGIRSSSSQFSRSKLFHCDRYKTIGQQITSDIVLKYPLFNLFNDTEKNYILVQ